VASYLHASFFLLFLSYLIRPILESNQQIFKVLRELQVSYGRLWSWVCSDRPFLLKVYHVQEPCFFFRFVQFSLPQEFSTHCCNYFRCAFIRVYAAQDRFRFPLHLRTLLILVLPLQQIFLHTFHSNSLPLTISISSRLGFWVSIIFIVYDRGLNSWMYVSSSPSFSYSLTFRILSIFMHMLQIWNNPNLLFH